MSRFLPVALRERMQALAQRLPDERMQALAERALARADRIFDQLENTAKVLDKVAHSQLSLLEKLDPIVDDLGRLVRLQLDDARRRLTGAQPPVIDVEPAAKASDE